MTVDVFAQFPSKLDEIGATGAQRFGDEGIVEQSQQQMLDRDELVPLAAGAGKGGVDGEFQLFAQHDRGSTAVTGDLT